MQILYVSNSYHLSSDFVISKQISPNPGLFLEQSLNFSEFPQYDDGFSALDSCKLCLSNQVNGWIPKSPRSIGAASVTIVGNGWFSIERKLSMTLSRLSDSARCWVVLDVMGLVSDEWWTMNDWWFYLNDKLITWWRLINMQISLTLRLKSTITRSILDLTHLACVVHISILAVHLTVRVFGFDFKTLIGRLVAKAVRTIFVLSVDLLQNGHRRCVLLLLTIC